MMYDQFTPTCIKILLSPADKEALDYLGGSTPNCLGQGGDLSGHPLPGLFRRLVGIGALAEEQERCFISSDFRVSDVTCNEQWRDLRRGGGGRLTHLF